MENSYASVWRLPLFVRFYGRITPVNQKGDGVFSRFHTSAKDGDFDDLYVSFNEELQPMTEAELLSRRNDLYVIGHCHAWSEWGRTFYKRYTLFSKEQIENLYDKSLHFRYGDDLEGLFSYGQAQVFNMEDFLKNIRFEECEENTETLDLPFGDAADNMPF